MVSKAFDRYAPGSAAAGSRLWYRAVPAAAGGIRSPDGADSRELVPGYSSVLALCESLKSPSEISLSPAYSLETASRSASVAFKAMLLVLESVERDTIVSAVACSVKLSLTNRPLTITNWPPVLGLSAGSYTTFWATSRKVHFLKFSLLKPAGSWLKSN